MFIYIYMFVCVFICLLLATICILGSDSVSKQTTGRIF